MLARRACRRHNAPPPKKTRWYPQCLKQANSTPAHQRIYTGVGT
jgi:hypothetical protein